MKILVMGGNQFLGKTLTEKLLTLNYEVFVLNRGNRKNLVGTRHIKADRKNLKDLQEKLKDLSFDIVVDISAYTREDVKNFYTVMKGKFKQYILISSASIYNDNKDFPVNENSNTGKNILWGDYAENKYLAELETQKIEENYTIFRPFYIYGIGNNLDREQYIFSRIENNLPVYLPNEGRNIVQFGYVDDLVNAVIFTFENSKFYKQIFNVSSEEYVTIKEFTELCSKVMGENINIKYVDRKKNLEARAWFPFRDTDLYGSVGKLLETGFKNKYSLEEGLTKTYKYLKENNLLNLKLTNLEIEWNKI